MQGNSFALAMVVAACVSVAGCGGIVDPSQNVSQPFTGTIARGDLPKTYPFSVSKTGEVSVKITALSPTSSQPLGVAILQDSCSGNLYLGPNNFAQLNVTALSGQIFNRSYCLLVFETQQLATTQSFTVTVSHP